ncbi:MAG TPA: PH domain-containing protein [Anaerolineae bacterium]|nr:PH domain-containing protein [Anaerolineae bacterium]
MGLFDGLLGHATSVDVQKLQNEFAPILVDEEELLAAYKLIRDMFVFTNMRLILIDKQGVTGKKAEYQTIPYYSIVRFAKESAGILDLDAELKIWIRGQSEPIVKEFKKGDSVNEVYRLLGKAVLQP